MSDRQSALRRPRVFPLARYFNRSACRSALRSRAAHGTSRRDGREAAIVSMRAILATLLGLHHGDFGRQRIVVEGGTDVRAVRLAVPLLRIAPLSHRVSAQQLGTRLFVARQLASVSTARRLRGLRLSTAQQR
jgi:hypothetical protein